MKLCVFFLVISLCFGRGATSPAAAKPSAKQAPAAVPAIRTFTSLEPQTWRPGTNSALQITRAKPLFLETPLVAEGRTVSAIAAPARYLTLAKTIQAQILKKTGATVTIVNDAELASEAGLWNADGISRRNRSLIILGNLETSRLIPLLYARGYTGVDAGFPGKDGFVLQTIHDAWGNGKNVILAGGSDDAGVRVAVAALVQVMEKLPAGPKLAIPRQMRIRALQETLRAVGFPAGALDAGKIEEAVRLAKAAFAKGQHTGLTRDLVRAAHGYSKTGHDAYAELFKQLARAMHEIYKSKPATYGGPWGMDADFNSMKVMIGWDLVEESPAFSEPERLEVTRIIAEYAAYVANYSNTRQALQPGIRHNHNTFPCLGTLFAAEYFGKYYQSSEAGKWLENADACFQEQALSFKPQEDANGYQWLTTQHMLRYALARPDHKIFTNGNARAILDLAVGTMDNLGWQSPFGDVGGLRGTDSDVPLLSMGAWYYRDGGYKWAIQKGLADSQDDPARFEYGLGELKPSEPKGFSGMRVFPMSGHFYRHWAPRAVSSGGKPWVAPLSQTYDKITFRDGFAPEKPYLLLDGIGCGGHRHFDGNAIIRYSEHSRQWIADGDYIEALPRFHTSVLVYRDGQSVTLPPFCALEARADFASAGMVQSTVREYGGVDWSRNLIWLKGVGFIAIDALKASTPGDYSFRAVWHTIGKPTIAGQRYSVEQQDKRMVLDNVDGSPLKLTASEHLGRNLRGYTNADPVVQILQQVSSRKLLKGETFHFLNVFSTSDTAGEHPVKALRATDSSILVTKASDTWLVGVTGSQRTKVTGNTYTDAAVYALQPGRFQLASATGLEMGGQRLLDSDLPVSADLDFASGVAVIECDTIVRLKICGESHELKPGRQNLALPKGAAKPEFFLPPSAPVTNLPAVDAPSPRSMDERWSFMADFKNLAVADLDGDAKAEITAAGSNTVICLDTEGKERWRFSSRPNITALWAGKPGVAVGCADGALQMLNHQGQVLWSHSFPYYKRDPVVTVIFGGDINGDGKEELICGTEAWHFYALDAAGKRLWQFEAVHDSTCGTAVDLDGDGKQEVLAGTRYYWWHAVDPIGQKLWSYRTLTGPHATCVAAGELGGAPGPEVAFGGADGNLHVLNAKGLRILNLNTGDEVSDVLIAGKRIYATSTSYNLFAFDGQGRKLWRRERADMLNSLALVGDETNFQIAVGCEDGSVGLYTNDGTILNETRLSGPVVKLVEARNAKAELNLVVLVNGRGVYSLSPR